MSNLLDPIPLPLYPSEAKLLREYLMKIGMDAIKSRAFAPPSHFVLYDWYRTKFLSWAIRTEKRNPRNTYIVTGLPVGISILLVWELRNNPAAHILLQNVKNELCKQLMNRDLINFNE